MTAPPTHISVAGLLVPVALAPRIITAIRGLYPEVTQGIADNDAAVRAWLKHIIGATLASYEAAAAQQPATAAIEAVRQDYEARAEAARERAQTAAQAIQDSPSAT